MPYSGPRWRKVGKNWRSKVGHFRFRRSIGNKFFRVNVSKTGVSLTGGVPGAHVNADLSGRRKRPFMNTFGLPGTGVSYRTDSYGPERLGQRPRTQGSMPVGGMSGLAFVVGLITLLIVFMKYG